MTLKTLDIKKIGAEARQKFAQNPSLKSFYGTSAAYLEAVAGNASEFQASEKVQAEFQNFESYQGYKEGVALGRIKERKK